MNQIVSNRKFLYEVVPIRLFLVVMLVFYHAFAIFTGAWQPINGYPKIPVYNILGNLSCACLLETFVFISGYVFGNQVRKNGKTELSVKNIIVKKFKRLIIPSIIFSIAYLLIFGNINQPIHRMIYQILCGVGHMWFLPMLYWCFIIVCILEKLKIRKNIAVILLLFLSAISYLPLPFRLGAALYYAISFYIGYLIQKNDCKFEYSNKTILIVSVGFICFFILKIAFANSEGVQLFDVEILDKAVNLSLSSYIRLVCAALGIYLLYILSVQLVSNSLIDNWGGCIRLSNCCFGIYLFQQFVLKGIYNSTIPQMVNPYILPWLSFVIALIVSLAFTLIIRGIKVGRKIL